MRDEVTVLRLFQERRRQAYQAIFADIDDKAKAHWQVRFLIWLAALILPRDVAWREVFRGALVNIVLHDLKISCGAEKTSFSLEDSHETAFKEGRRFIWLFIQRRLRMSPAEIADLQEE